MGYLFVKVEMILVGQKKMQYSVQVQNSQTLYTTNKQKQMQEIDGRRQEHNKKLIF